MTKRCPAADGADLYDPPSAGMAKAELRVREEALGKNEQSLILPRCWRREQVRRGSLIWAGVHSAASVGWTLGGRIGWTLGGVHCIKPELARRWNLRPAS
jgi:hypothetical protein